MYEAPRPVKPAPDPTKEPEKSEAETSPIIFIEPLEPVSYTHLRAHET